MIFGVTQKDELRISFNDMHINILLHLSCSLWGIPLHCDLFGRTDQKKFL